MPKEDLKLYVFLAMKNWDSLKHLLLIILLGVIVEEMFVLIIRIVLYVEKVLDVVLGVGKEKVVILMEFIL